MSNELEVTYFKNDTDTPVELKWGGQSYGVCPAHSTVPVVRFVAEYYASRNKFWNLAEDSEVSKKIKKQKDDIIATELQELNRKAANAATEEAEELAAAEMTAKMANAKIAKNAASKGTETVEVEATE